MGSVETASNSNVTSSSGTCAGQEGEAQGVSESESASICEYLCYGPITSFEELMNYGQSQCHSMSQKCKQMTVPLLDNGYSGAKTRVGGASAKPIAGGNEGGKFPLTLVCHDLKGGYKDDRFVNGTNNIDNYTYRHWLLTDIFVYFSHEFVTIPPLGWINSAHSHGVKILGTIITEWDDGAKLCAKMLASEETINRTVEMLAQINKDYGFDGYLLNIENKLEGAEQVTAMLDFTRKLTQALKKQSSKNLVIWYDSVTKDGELKWQNALNEFNKIFFDACDAIYLNYNWTDEKLQKSVEMAGEERRYDVFVGVDCWGRGCWGGGGLNTNLAIDKIFPHDLSYALFAPGWTFESHPFSQYPFIDDEMWTKCMKNMYFRCLGENHIPVSRISEDGAAKSEKCDNDNTSYNNSNRKDDKKFQVFFATNFCRGYGTKNFHFGKITSENSWFDLSKQAFQPVIFSSLKCLNYDCSGAQAKLVAIVGTEAEKKKRGEKPCSKLIGEEHKVIYDTEQGFFGGGSLKLLNSKKRKDFEDPLTSSPIWIPMNIPVSASRLTLAVVAIWKSTSISHQLKMYLELGKSGCPNRKILLGSLDSLATSVRGKFFISLRLRQFLEGSTDIMNGAEISDLQFCFQKNNYDETELNGWRVSCYLFDIDQVYDEYSSVKSLRVGADGDISLGFLSLGQIIHYQQ